MNEQAVSKNSPTSRMQEFLRLVKHPLKFRWFLLSRLPAAFFSGLRIEYADEERCTVSIPYKWLNQNPFRSTYFASLSMAAEMSTGILAMSNTYKVQPKISMLVISVNSEYFQKARSRVYFTCVDGLALQALVAEAVATGEARTFTAKSLGKDKEGNSIAAFSVSWSFRQSKR